MFTPEEKIQLFNRLPALELSYEPKLHKKVYSPVYYVIPKGPKALVWYTYWGEDNVCLLILLNERGNYSDIKMFPAVFSDALALGTIIYGTHFTYKQKPYFTCEQLYYYKGMPMMKKKSYMERLDLLLEIFQKHITINASANASASANIDNNTLIVGLPVMTETYEEGLEKMAELPYNTYGLGGNPPDPLGGKPPHPPSRVTLPIGDKAFGVTQHTGVSSVSGHMPIQHLGNNFENTPMTPKPSGVFHPSGGVGARPPRGVNSVGGQLPIQRLGNNFTNNLRAPPKPKAVFHPSGGVGGFPPRGVTPLRVKAELAADTYSLYNIKDNTLVGTAMIPTYKCSVLLNSLFRNIKENKNLDFLEESDDEEEFENTQLDKFVDLDKTIVMECVYLKRFQKWQPVRQIQTN